MRQAGTLPVEQAKQLGDYLLTQGIEIRIEPGAAGAAIWVIEEEKVAAAKEILAQFQSNPSDPRYQAAAEAANLRRQIERRHALAAKNIIDGRRAFSDWGQRSGSQPLTIILIALCVTVAVLTRAGKENQELMDRMFIAQAPVIVQRLPVADSRDVEIMRIPANLGEIRHGEVWRLVTPIFLHFGGMHLLFNMLWLFQLGGLIERRKGTLIFGLLVLVLAVDSNLGQFYASGNPYFGGMSGVVYGLFGYIWMKGRYQPQEGMRLSPQTIFLMLVWFAICMSGSAGPIANWAHGVGLAVGVLCGVAPYWARRLLR